MSKVDSLLWAWRDDSDTLNAENGKGEQVEHLGDAEKIHNRELTGLRLYLGTPRNDAITEPRQP